VKLPRTANPELTQVLQLYVERFNRRDWNGLRELIAADARLRVADALLGNSSIRLTSAITNDSRCHGSWLWAKWMANRW